MLIRSLFLAIFLMPSVSAVAAEQFFVDFKIIKDDRKIEWGKFYVTNKQHVWSKGLKRTYAKVSCVHRVSGKQQKTVSMIDLFSGVRVTHKLDGGEVKLKVVRNTAQPVLKEIRALGKDECRELSPIVTTITQHYSLPAKTGVSEQYVFSEKLTFNVKLYEMGGSKK